MHHGTCVTHVPWCMSGSLTCGGGENVPGIPGACAPAILRIWQEAHGFQDHLHIVCLLNRLFRRTWKAPSKLHVTSICKGCPVDYPHIGPVTRKIFPFVDVIMKTNTERWSNCWLPTTSHSLLWRGVMGITLKRLGGYFPERGALTVRCPVSDCADGHEKAITLDMLPRSQAVVREFIGGSPPPPPTPPPPPPPPHTHTQTHTHTHTSPHPHPTPKTLWFQ